MKKYLGVLIACALTLGVVQSADAKTTKPVTTVYFSVSQSNLSSKARASIAHLAKTLKSTDVVDVRGYVQRSQTSANDISLAAARATQVKAFLVALGVKAKITSKGYGLPTVNRSAASSRRVDLYVAHKATKPSASPSSSPSQSFAGQTISGTIERNILGGDCSQLWLDYVDLYRGNVLVSEISHPTWTSTNGDCIYDYTFSHVADGTYNVVESYSTSYPPMYSYSYFSVTSAVPSAWTVTDSAFVTVPSVRSYEVRRSPDLVISGSSLTGIDLRTMLPPP